VLKNDLPLTNFVHSDFTNAQRSAREALRIPGVTGQEFKKVTLPKDSHRGGVLTMSGVMKVTANGTTTSPVLRGAWVLDRILGTPPPKPTVDVEAVEPDIRGATTIREQLREAPAARRVRRVSREDRPAGFALESYDVIGGWREYYRSVGKGGPGGRGRPHDAVQTAARDVDASDVLPDG